MTKPRRKLQHQPHGDAVAAFQSMIWSERARVAATFQGADKRLALLDLVRGLDAFAVATMSPDTESKARQAAPLYSLGWSGVLGPYVSDVSQSVGFPLYPTGPEGKAWADSVIQHSGRIALCELLLELIRSGAAHVARTDDDEYTVRLPHNLLRVERLEREEFHWLADAILRHQRDDRAILREEAKEIRKLMAGQVSVYKHHYIGYGALPEIDEHYERRGILAAQCMTGQDSFAGEAMFGGEPFDLYRGAVGILIGWALKHIEFCGVLIDRNPAIDWRNVLTITVDKDRFADSLSEVLGVTRDRAYKAIESLTLDITTKPIHCSEPGGPYAPFVDASPTQLLKSIAGLVERPFSFLLRHLRGRYLRDWDSALDAREEIFRRDLYALFPRSRFTTLAQPLRITEGRRVVTDVDALIYDRVTHAVGLFQLKWQDPYGPSPRVVRSRRTNLLTAGTAWIEKVTHWLQSRPLRKLLEDVLPAAADSAHIQPYLFVLGRNFAHFSGPDLPDQRAAWGMWPQVGRLFHDRLDPRNPIAWLHRELKADAPYHRIESTKQVSETMKLGHHKVVMIED